MKRFLAIFFVYSAVLFLMTILFSKVAPGHMVSEAILFMVPFFFLITVLSRLIFRTVVRKNPRLFSITYLAITGFRFLLYLMILVSYSVVFPHDAVGFIVQFFVFYFLFTVVEVFLLYNELRPGSAA